jgi:hypothetical protein
MSFELQVVKYTREQVESLELAPGARQEKLEGWVPELASDAGLRQALDKALDYRGDVTLTLKSGERIAAYIFNRQTGATLADSRVQYFTAGAAEKRQLGYADIARIEFTGKDCAAGKHWEDWVRKHQERKAAGEKGIALHPEALD